MKSFLFIFLILLSLVITGANANAKATVTTKLDQKIRFLSKFVSLKGCRSAQVCFALDNNQKTISQKEYILQKLLVKSISKVISNDKNVRFSALQYGVIGTLISPFSKASKTFFGQLDKAVSKPQAGTSLDAPIVLCDALFAQAGKTGTMILFGNGRKNFGGDPQLTSGVFKRRGGKIFGVGVGNMDTKAFQKIAGDRSHTIQKLDQFWKVSYILEKVVTSVCF